MIKETGKIIKEVARVCDFCGTTNINIGFKSKCTICQKDVCDSHSICIGEYTFCSECHLDYPNLVTDAGYANLLDLQVENYIAEQQDKIDKIRSGVWDKIKEIHKNKLK